MTGAPRRRAILVTGMHRSGTSAVAGTLACLGVPMGSKLVPPSEHNPRGYWEHAEIVDAHERLLSSLGSSWDDVAPLPDGWLTTSAATRARRELEEILRRDFASMSLFAVKDPRMCRLLSLWSGILRDIQCQPLIVLVVRNPVEVARSLESRDKLHAARSYLLWLDHFLTAESHSRSEERVLLMYSDFLADWRKPIDRMEAATGVAWPKSPRDVADAVEAFLSPSLRHHLAVDDLDREEPAVPSWVKRAYAALLATPDLSDEALVSSLTELNRRFLEAAELYAPEALQVSQPLLQRRLELEEGLRATQAELQKQYDSFLVAKESLAEDLSTHRAAKAELEAELNQERKGRLSLSKEVEEERQARVSLRQELDEEHKARVSLRQELDEERRERFHLRNELRSLRAANASSSHRPRDTSSGRHELDCFQAAWVGESIRPVLVVSGRYVASRHREGTRIELRCDGEPIAATECSVEEPQSSCRFRIQTPLPDTGTRFDLVAADNGAVLATRLRWHLWPPHVRDTYAAFCSNHTIRPHLRDLLLQTVERLDRRPPVTLVLPVGAQIIKAVELDETLDSIQEQIYPEWEVRIAVEEREAGLVAERINQLGDPRITLATLEDGAGYGRLVNAAALSAGGEFLGVLHPGDLLAPQALFELARHLQLQAVPDLVYSDHDFVDSKGIRSNPQLKPEWSPTFFLSHDYIGRFMFLRRSLFAKYSGCGPDFEGAASYDLLLRVTEETDQVVHIPQVLFHARRQGRDGLETDGKNDEAAEESAARLAALERRSLPARLARSGTDASRPTVVGNLEWPDDGPRVTIIIPTFNQHAILRRCLESILYRTTYLNFDVLIVDNGSDCTETLNYLQEVRAQPRIRTIRVPRSGEKFSFAKVNNVAVQATEAEYVLLLNNDTEVLEPRWLSRLMGYARLPGVGVSGARLLYPQGTIQHAGIALGMNDGLAPGHLFYGHAGDAAGYLQLAGASREVSAVTGACLLTKRELFLELGGLDENDFPTVLNDVDYCLRVAERGLRSVYVAHAQLLHLESASRSREDDPSQLAAFKRRHGGKRERYWSPSLELKLGAEVAVDPRCRLGYQSLLPRPLRVLWILPEGGDEDREPTRMALEVAERFPRFELSVLAPGRSISELRAEPGGRIRLIDGAGLPGLHRVWEDHLELTRLIRNVHALLEAQRPDVLVAASLEAFPYVNAAAAASVPSVWLLAEHVAPDDRGHRVPPSARAYLDIAFASAQRIAFASRHTLSLWKRLDTRTIFGLFSGAPRPETADPTASGSTTNQARRQLRLPAETQLILTPVGQGPVHRWQTFLAAVKLLSDERRDFRVLLLGSPGTVSTVKELHKRAKKLGLRRFFTVAPPAHHDLCYRTADIIALGSCSGLRPAELSKGMAQSLPIVSGESWELGERIFEQVNALVCAENDAPSLAAAMARLLSDSELRQELGAGSHELASSLEGSRDVDREVGSLVAEAWQIGPANGPRFGLLIDVEEASEDELRETIESIRQQTYHGWDLCLVGGVHAAKLFGFLRAVGSFDYRYIVRLIEDPAFDRAMRLNRALEAVPSSWIGVLDPGDKLPPFALDELAAFLDKNPSAELIYADEERALQDGRTAVRVKPEWSPEMLIGEFYLGRPWLARRSLFGQLGGFRSDSGRATEWDLVLRASEHGAKVGRVSIPCCVRAERTEAEDADDEARMGCQVVRNHLSRLGLDAKIERTPAGLHRAVCPVVGEPVVSIVIPNRNSFELIRECLDGIRHRTGYKNREILIVDNRTTDSAVLELYDSLAQSGEARILPLEGAFNYSAACNLGAREANGELLLFLNNDIEVLDQGWLEEMVGWSQIPGVGVVGCKLLYQNGRIQHAGVTLGLNGLSGHLFYGAPEDDTAGPFGSADQYRNVMAVTGACQLMPGTVYQRLGGYDERYSLIYSDVDICVRAWQAGYRVVYTPFARLIHHEGSSRAKLSPLEDGDVFARRLARLGLDSDPYFHPGLRGDDPVPKIRGTDEPGAANILQWWLKHILESEPASAPLDVYHCGELEQVLAGWNLTLSRPSRSPQDVEELESGAARFILATLLEDDVLRRRFPRALSDGAQGSYCRWLCEEQANELGLSAAARKRIRNVFLARPGDLIRRLYFNRQDLQREHPLALTPVGLRSFLRWLLTTGRADYGVTDEAIWWHCLASWEDGADGLLDSFLVNPSWQILFPDALTPFGWEGFRDWLGRQYPTASDWLRSVPRPLLPSRLEELRSHRRHRPQLQRVIASAERKQETGPLCKTRGNKRSDSEWLEELGREQESSLGEKPGINVMANFCYPSGVQQAAVASVEAFRLAGWETSCRDVPTAANPLRVADVDRWHRFLGLEVFDHTLLHVQPDILSTAYDVAGLAPRSNTFRIGVWYWELETPPPAPWIEACSMLDEIWAPTRFIAEAFRSVMPVEVVLMPPGVGRPTFDVKPRSHFGLDPDSFLFHFMFDCESVTERKNPLGLIRAFRRAFRPEEKAHLVIKMLRGRLNVEARQRILKAADEAQVTIIEDLMPKEELSALLNVCDCYVSLHRSEGFGLPLAEAMLLGKPVIATAYSGNMEFMTPANSLLVDFERVELERDYPPYPKGGIWAEPSEEHAVQLMRWVFEHREEARSLGDHARQELDKRLSLESAGKRMVGRLCELGAKRLTRTRG